MQKFIGKPKVIEAMQWTGQNATDIMSWTNSQKEGVWTVNAYDIPNTDSLIIETLEGKMEARPGDWIIKGIKGEFYPCKPDIFEKSYMPVKEQPIEGERISSPISDMADEAKIMLINQSRIDISLGFSTEEEGITSWHPVLTSQGTYNSDYLGANLIDENVSEQEVLRMRFARLVREIITSIIESAKQLKGGEQGDGKGTDKKNIQPGNETA